MQVGTASSEARFAVSTVAEIEFLLPMFHRLQHTGRRVNVLYGVPLPPSQTSRLARIARQLGQGSMILMIDHTSQLQSLQTFSEEAGFPAGVFLKVDTGYHRAGLPPSALNKRGLLQKLVDLQKQGVSQLVGLYSHSSLSYSDSSSSEAMNSLRREIEGCIDALDHNKSLFPKDHPLLISVGASPQVMAIQNLAEGQSSSASIALIDTISKLSAPSSENPTISLELHAGVYSVLDMQQIATRSVDSWSFFHEEVALCVLAEVISVYDEGERSKPEALIAAGTLALGREPCHAYPGWGVVELLDSSITSRGSGRLIIDRISQEHAIVAWQSCVEQNTPAHKLPLVVGEIVRIYPNHACVTGAMFERYFVVDSDDETGGRRVIDVWERARGW